uniref:uncharacterized protein LOC113475505 n=1 Tax=Ciona intestinalis TaxID=7719 RepID=UPI000EF5591F|nr:uncharacterized protein LOC113475505 [Ciona intestinalis]|eukprot:XP_026695493.1 uncharacterized protein LOC113475505 [Ciona intestinalis]
MECRTALAALHFNENAHRAQSVTKDGVPVYGIHYPKYKKGGYIVRKVIQEATYEYVGDLLQIVKSICQRDNNLEVEETLTDETTRLPLSSSCEKPDRDSAIKNHVSRFMSNSLY